jgi:hypothetical protein
VRGHAAEFGIIAAKGIAQIEPVQLGSFIGQLDAQLVEMDQRLTKQHKADPVRQRPAWQRSLTSGQSALTMTVETDTKQFESGRHFAAWLGLTPKEQSTAGRQCAQSRLTVRCGRGSKRAKAKDGKRLNQQDTPLVEKAVPCPGSVLRPVQRNHLGQRSHMPLQRSNTCLHSFRKQDRAKNLRSWGVL